MKVLILIISNETYQVYIKHKQIWLKYMNLDPIFDCFFIEYHPEKGNIIEGNTIFIKGNESFHPGIREKTIDCFDYFLKCDTKYDYIIRTNLSSLWNFKSLLTHLKTLPKEGVYAGVIGNAGTKCLVNYASGSGIIMTPDIVNIIIQNRHICNEMNFIDDVDFGYLLHTFNIFPTPIGRVDIYNDDMLHSFQYNSDVYHYRIKYEGDRNGENEASIKILNMILSS